jgi:hypothetical protein
MCLPVESQGWLSSRSFPSSKVRLKFCSTFCVTSFEGSGREDVGRIMRAYFFEAVFSRMVRISGSPEVINTVCSK